MPEALKKLEEFFKAQMKNMRPPSGGEKAHTTDEVGTKVDGPVDNLLLKQGNLGLLGNLGEAPLAGGHTGTYQGGSNPSVFGGNVDFGPDSDKVGWTGKTIQDSPGDLHFGKEEAVAGMPNSGKSDRILFWSSRTVLVCWLVDVLFFEISIQWSGILMK